MVSRRVLETLTYLARNHPYVAKILLQSKLPVCSSQEPENTSHGKGKAVMVVDEGGLNKQHEHFPVTLILNLLNQPLYLRSIAHLEQVTSFCIYKW